MGFDYYDERERQRNLERAMSLNNKRVRIIDKKIFNNEEAIQRIFKIITALAETQHALMQEVAKLKHELDKNAKEKTNKRTEKERGKS